MKLGLFFEWPNPTAGDWKHLFEEGIEQIQLAEELGFDFVFIAEHHFSNYGMSPAPLMQALAIAERTKTIRIGTTVLVLPMWQPLRVAEEVAVLDNLTNGRFFCGIGRGYQPHEFERAGVTLEDSRDRFTECLDVLLKAWSMDTSFTYEGRYVQIPNPTVVWPKPVQKPHPIKLIAGTSADTLRLAAQMDVALLVSGFGGTQAVRDMTLAFLRERAAIGLPLEAWELGAQTFCHVAPSNEEARAAAKYPRWQQRAQRALSRRDVPDGRVNATPVEGEPDDEAFWDALYYGDPDRVRSKYLALAEAGATFASCWMMTGGMPHELLMRSIKLMGEEVLPAVHEAERPVGLIEGVDGTGGGTPRHAQSRTPSG
jgi:alkanesulfonate monooxygenase SsuD/methylene tetrahydromethanopterin reductase-like flavin-dependent oxidoreductase (luciferase family)